MSMNHDPELDDVLQDDELRRIASLLQATRRAEPPARRGVSLRAAAALMQQAWGRRSRTPGGSLGRRLARMGGCAAGILLIASVVLYMTSQQPGTLDSSPIADSHGCSCSRRSW
jgi:hypothetical protein